DSLTGTAKAPARTTALAPPSRLPDRIAPGPQTATFSCPVGGPQFMETHLRKSPLAGVPAKSMIVQFAKGDTNQLNPTTAAFLRGGDLATPATFYRHDLAFAEDPTLDRNPHQFLIRVVGNPGERRIALGYQSQIAAFFASDGEVIIHPEPARFFET